MNASLFASVRQVASRSALLLVLGLGLGSCEKILDQTPQNSIDASTGFATRQDAIAGLRGCYDALQSANYYGLRYQTFADLISNNIRHTGTFPTFAQVAQNSILPDNTDTRSVWIAIYDGIQRTNYFINSVTPLSDPAYNTPSAIGEARALRALHYMNLLGYWGGSTLGYGYADGLGVPLRLTPTLAVGPDTQPVARATEAAVTEAIRADLDFAITNLVSTATTGITKNAALALRARFELRVRNYSEALRFANQVTGNVTTGDVLFQLQFNVNDQNQLAFFWFPAASGGRNELDPSDDLAAAHPTGDNRLPINVVTSSNATTVYPAGTTRKYFTIATNSDPVNVIRYSEVALTIAEAAAQSGNLALAATQVNAIRTKAGLANTTATTQAALLTEILLQRRLELAHEGLHWFDLRRTNRVQTAIPAYTQTFRNLWPIPFQEILNSGGTLVQNPGGF
ncbi:MAG: RagB/SusD family nutrient uptake outer membrane protein [Hymenobacter sp.]|nr:MAG: RagB/SusD family nutrient uptake outer membrane protein [Hymenobacter sp.]